MALHIADYLLRATLGTERGGKKSVSTQRCVIKGKRFFNKMYSVFCNIILRRKTSLKGINMPAHLCVNNNKKVTHADKVDVLV